MKDKIFEKPRTIFQQDVNDIMKDCDEINLIEDLIGLQLLKDAEKDEKLLVIKELYNYLGTEKFMGIMNILAGKTIKFPTKDSFKETIQIALSWYYRQYKGYDWDQIKTLLRDDELPAVKYGIKVQNLQRFINKYEEIRIKRAEANGKQSGNE